jgi:hypothetical protein
VPNLLVVSDRHGPGVVGMKNYGREMLLEDAKVRAEASVKARAARLANSSLSRDNLDAAPEVQIDGANEDYRISPRRWFTLKGWRGDKDKNLPAFHLLRTLYPDKKWYVMLDDDTYIFLDAFAEFTSRHSSPEDTASPLFTGKAFYVSNCGSWGRNGKNMDVPNGPRATFAHGGSGIVLNGVAMEMLFVKAPQCVRKFSSCWAGDVQVSLCLLESGVTTVRYGSKRTFEKHFTPFSPGHALRDARYVTRWHSSERPITFHKAPVSELQMLADFERQCMRDRVPVLYNTLRHFLVEDHKLSAS